MKKIILITLALALAAFAFSCQKDDDKITNPVTLDKTVYKADLTAGVSKQDDGSMAFDGDIHVEDADFMYWPAGFLGKHSLPTDKFTLGTSSKEFKSGNVHIYLDSKSHVCLVLDAVLSTGSKLKISVRTAYSVDVD